MRAVGTQNEDSGTAIYPPDHPSVTSIELLAAKVRIGAYLFRYGYIDLQSAVDQIQRYAERTGAVDALGQDHVQQIIAAEFDPIEREVG